MNSVVCNDSLITKLLTVSPRVIYSWHRFMLGMAAVPGVVQFFGFLFMPESPRWLVGKGKMEDAKAVLLRMRGGTDVEEELEEIRVTVLEAEKDSAGVCVCTMCMCEIELAAYCANVINIYIYIYIYIYGGGGVFFPHAISIKEKEDIEHHLKWKLF